MRIFLHGVAICCPRGGVAEASRRARGGSRRLAEPRRPHGELIFVILPSKFHFAEQIARQIARQIAQIDGFAQQMENLPSKVTK